MYSDHFRDVACTLSNLERVYVQLRKSGDVDAVNEMKAVQFTTVHPVSSRGLRRLPPEVSSSHESL